MIPAGGLSKGKGEKLGINYKKREFKRDGCASFFWLAHVLGVAVFSRETLPFLFGGWEGPTE